MSGGYFRGYSSYQLEEIIESIRDEIYHNKPGPRTGTCPYSPETIKEFENAIDIIRKAKIYIHRLDYLFSSDDGEETFHERLKKDLAE